MKMIRLVVLFMGIGGLLSFVAVSTVTSAIPPISRARLIDPTSLPLAPLKLSGRLVFTEIDIRQLDMTTGVFSTLFQTPTDGSVMALAVSPDKAQIAIAYQAPPDKTTPNAVPRYGYTNIYLLPGDGSGAPKPYLKTSADDDILILPFWSPDGKYLYYVHYNAAQDTYNLERVVYPGTKPETIAKQVLFASISPDGSKVAYLQQDQTNYQYTLNIADSSGTNPIQLVASNVFFTMDVAIFSPDGKSVVFSASGQPTAFVTPVGPVGVTDWFGKGIAMDGNVPSDLWQISVHGGTPQRLTKLGEFSLYPAFSPDGKHIAILAAGGIYLMNANGTGLRQLTDEGGVGTLDWVP